MKKSYLTVTDQFCGAGGSSQGDITHELARMATSHVYDQQIIFNDNEEWILPAGAYGESCGPM